MCSVCARTGWRGYLLSCPRPRNCTSSMSQEIGLSSPLVAKSLSAVSKIFKGRKQHPLIVPQHVLALFSLLCFVASSLLQESPLLSSRQHATTLSKQVPSTISSFFPFLPGCQTCRSLWPRYASRPCGCRWTSHSLSSLFRPTWSRRRARRCSPVCCCLNSPAMTTTVMLRRQIRRLECVLR